jgi:hypothetical protein
VCLGSGFEPKGRSGIPKWIFDYLFNHVLKSQKLKTYGFGEATICCFFKKTWF